MLTIKRTLFACAMAVTGFAAAGAQTVPPQDDPFSILAPVAPEPDPEPATAGREPQAGLHMTRNAYVTARGDRQSATLLTIWQVESGALDGTPISQSRREVVIGDGYVAEMSGQGVTVHDFAFNRILRPVNGLSGQVMRNTRMTAHVHRQMDTFTFYTRGGQLDEIATPGGTVFERFWIEAAMGVRLSPVDMLRQDGEDQVEVRRDQSGSAIFTFVPGREGSSDEADLFRRWLRHQIPLHPDALVQLSVEDRIPEQFSFLVFSPASPMGRRETWTRINTSTPEIDFPWPDFITPAAADNYELPDPNLLRLVQAGLTALSNPAYSPNETSFIAAADEAQARADRAGAYLALIQASNHFGPCTSQAGSPVCQRLGQATAAGLGDPQFEQIAQTLAAMGQDRAAALTQLQSHMSREGLAGAGANLLAAQALATLRATDPAALPDLNPISLFANAAEADPYAPLTYWHAGRYAASLGDIETAWLLFDIALNLPNAERSAALRDAQTMHNQLRDLAPLFFAPGPE